MAESDEPWSNLGFAEEAAVFVSASQNARVLSEGWVAANLFCPCCGCERLDRLANNSPVADFRCPSCREEYELKAARGRIGVKLNDGAYGAMKQRLTQANNPSLLAMAYDRNRERVTDLIVVPNHFVTEAIIEPRKPLGPTARRAGWQGCNILISKVPEAGRIPLIRGSVQVPKSRVMEQWRSTLFLRGATLNARGWLLEVMKAVEDIGLSDFTLADAYAFEDRLSAAYPGNNNVRPKIRQQLQVLRDHGWLEFLGGGRYRLRELRAR
jgi:type II restriction enzyme